MHELLIGSLIASAIIKNIMSIEQINLPEKNETNKSDLPDNQHDLERMQPEETTLDLPDVEDIPGQEFIHPPRMGSYADTTISSADEEGEGIFDDDDEALGESDVVQL
ncbi:MAG: hypothetical protein ABIY51_11725 [Ferruginibacter sp.]